MKLVKEILRLASVINVNLFRKADSDTEIGGFPVPKNTAVSAELSLILSDEKRFPNPDVFDPSRFINDPSLSSIVVPFGLGRRVCLGESLARAELYLVIIFAPLLDQIFRSPAMFYFVILFEVLEGLHQQQKSTSLASCGSPNILN
ncbi:unnamed protein product [Strongylus vulgaris]|uniref:Uncharacterized protein n=1 Tax=Strongylus vulgaris TaxID=40348 RepID=A0A3P7I5M7_STRVU|nr:unnamed protein product [Strongylus vulgaris]